MYCADLAAAKPAVINADRRAAELADERFSGYASDSTDHLTTINTLLVIYGGNLLPINNELKAVEDRRDLERIQLNAAIPKLMEDLRGQEVGAAQAEQCVRGTIDSG